MIHVGSCLDILPTLPANSVDAIVTDPPYHLTSIVKRFGADGAAPAGFGTDGAFARASRGFMGQQWDGGDIAFRPETWAHCLRVLKPGGHLAAFSGTRTYHRMTVAIEDAGFEIRDQLAWAYGSGFPKSHDVSKGIDKLAGAEREIIGRSPFDSRKPNGSAGVNSVGLNATSGGGFITAPATPEAAQWEGWGTALKPSFEPICLAQKPLTAHQELASLVPIIEDLTWQIACNALTVTSLLGSVRTDGFLNTVMFINRCMVGLLQLTNTFTIGTASEMTTDLKILNSCLSEITRAITTPERTTVDGLSSSVFIAETLLRSVVVKCEKLNVTIAVGPVTKRLALMGSDQADVNTGWRPIALARKPLDGTVARNVLAHGVGALNIDGCRVGEAGGTSKAGMGPGAPTVNAFGDGLNTSRFGVPVEGLGRWPANILHDGEAFGDATWSRYFYCAKASKADRDHGLEDMPLRVAGGMSGRADGSMGSVTMGRNNHPTVKPHDLMRWLCRLVTPPGGLVLDPFTGSGSTGRAALAEGFRFTGIELSADYARIAARRSGLPLVTGDLFA